MIMTKSQFKDFAPAAKRRAELYKQLEYFLPKYDIDNTYREAMFLSQCHHESAGFKYIEENLNYSAKALDRVFGKYFRTGGRNPYDYSRKPEKIANVVYANRMGNGDEESGDGWKYRGRGYIQLTGKYNYQSFADYVDADLDEVIEYLETVKGAVDSACWYWESRNLNSLADIRDIEQVTIKINGGYHGLEARTTLYNRAIDLMEEFPEEDKPFGGKFNITLQFGDRGKDVEDLQRAFNIRVDGVFGKHTEQQVRGFQRKIGVKDNGVADPYTLTKLYTNL